MEEIMATNRFEAEALPPVVRRRVWNVFLWVLQIAAAGMFFFAAWGKLTANPLMVATFEAIGLGQWFRVFTGALEVIGATILLTPRLAGAGATLLAVIMVGAVLTHLFILGGSPLLPLLLLVAMLLVAFSRPNGIRQAYHSLAG
ncbi:MAG TPA: DoxX family protein [Longimicrobiaceae bacterium]